MQGGRMRVSTRRFEIERFSVTTSRPFEAVVAALKDADGKIALVTGASKGIGAGIALSLANEGAAIAVNYHSDRAGADRVVENIKLAGGKAITVQGSVTSSEEIDRFFNETEK